MSNRMSNATLPVVSSRNDTAILANAVQADADSTDEPASTIITTITTTIAPDGGLSGGAIAGIVIGCIVGIILLLLAAFFVYRWVKERRKNHGEYKPHEEEEEHAKNLPYLAPPSVEGLI
ncbi:hypothetical protein PMAYCL1PPCAC_04216 [Pristionchus mayeri]|uniref:Crb-3 n=1 Tax=Pristionchus mayeri TaxID=1317129 RepID=A0AAN4Z4S3_9BILA|nr:hypothetical protein PMAYCL1PPCAC_04216 [Pristionchus mayeri]